MENSDLKNQNQETPLLQPIYRERYPFKNNHEDFNEDGDYILRYEAIEILKKTVGTPTNKSMLKAFLAKECNIPDPTNYSFPDIIAALQLYLKHNCSKTSNCKPPNTQDQPSTKMSKELFSDRQLEVWNLLENKCLSAKELGKTLDLTAENIRKHIEAIRKKMGQQSIKTSSSRGYWRPDSPPPDHTEKS